MLFLALTLLLINITTISAEIQVPSSINQANELNSPSDWISEDQIKVYDDKVVLELEGTTWASFTDTNSMDPFLDETANAIEIMPESAKEIQNGDIISYQSKDSVIIHRVIYVGEDIEGTYYLVQGDNNNYPDPVKVRFNEVVGVLVAIIY